MRFLRRLHLWLGCFFAPMLLFYVGTGWYQTMNLNRTKSSAEATDWVSRLREVHVNQHYPASYAEGYSTGGYKILVVAMSIALIATVLLGIVLAFQTQRKKWIVAGALALGIIVPALTLWLAQKYDH